MGQVLYRQYRPKSLKEVVGQEHITVTLQHALTSGKLAHAYLFTGPRGVGKTSVARILAHEVNNLAYSDDRPHLDIIEIDAASNRRIDEIRELRDKVNLVPTSAKYKVYIIDEVHMLTREAFNALLKTLEEPPDHVIFILATTEAHKLPETIVSRTQRFSFKPVESQKVVDHLKKVAKKEKITVDDAALKLIAEHGEGSFRDSISLLDQLRHRDEQISYDTVRSALGLAPDEVIADIASSIIVGKRANIINRLSDLFDQGFQAQAIAKQLAAHFRTQLIQGSLDMPQTRALRLLRQLLLVPTSSSPESALEIDLLDAVQREEKQVSEVEPMSQEIPDKKINKTNDQPEQLKVSVMPLKKSSAKKMISAPPEEFVSKIWPGILQQVKAKHNALYSVLRLAKPQYSEGSLELQFEYKFHALKIKEAKNQKTIADLISDATGDNVAISCVVVENAATIPSPEPNKTALQPATISPETLETINNIFGSSEMIES